MKKRYFLILLIFVITACVFLAIYFEPVVRQKVFKKMALNEFLYDKNSNHWNELYLDKNGNASYKGMVIIKNKDHKPINSETAFTDDELIIYFRAQGIRPEEWGCDISDTINNGTLGCYLLMPSEKPH